MNDITTKDSPALFDNVPNSETSKLRDRFIVPPFSVLDTKQGYWQNRKRSWQSLGIESELGRDAVTYQIGDKSQFERQQSSKEYNVNEHLDEKSQRALGCYGAYGKTTLERASGSATGTSIFDPVLTELHYTWYCKPNGKIIDPFAGGSVRGIVAAYLGFCYTGIDLSAKQIEANNQQWKTIRVENDMPGNITWYQGDSANINQIAPGEYDYLFSCPPYYDLEVYSKQDGELSNMDYPEFVDAYRDIIKKSCRLLKDNTFATFVVGDIRDKKGIYRNFVSDTIGAFIDAGLDYYNEGILITSVGSLAIRVTNQFNASRKLGKMHQNVLTFVKGSGKEATKKIIQFT